jgi:hypothetical protein
VSLGELSLNFEEIHAHFSVGRILALYDLVEVQTLEEL